jgi:hypothetical protein
VIGQSQFSGVAVALWAVALVFASERAPAAAMPPVKARQVTIPIYAEGQTNAVAVLRADRVGREQRRLGFFRVKLLPLFVVEGARLELAPSTSPDDLLTRVQAGLEPLTGRVPFEFRGFRMFFPGETPPRLSARSVRPVPAASTWALEDVTFQSDHGPVVLPQARLLFEGEPGRLVWQTRGATAQWNLFRGTSSTNPLALIGHSK